MCILIGRNLNEILKLIFSTFGCRCGIDDEKCVTALIDWGLVKVYKKYARE